MINSISSNFKPEAVAAEIIENGQDINKLQIIRNLVGKIQHAKEITQISEEKSEFNLTNYLKVVVNRDGIYDILPEGLFHKPIFNKTTSSKEKVIYEMRKHREEEAAARKFFRLFEMEIDRTLIIVRLFKNRYEKKITYRDFYNLFTPYWSVIDLMNLRQAFLFLNIIPLLHKIRLKLNDIAESLSVLLDIPVRIEKYTAKDKKLKQKIGLGNLKLGVNFVLGGAFDDGLYDLNIIIGPIPASQMVSFVEGDAQREILNELCLIFLPANSKYDIRFKVRKEESKFVLGKSRLGIDTVLLGKKTPQKLVFNF